MEQKGKFDKEIAWCREQRDHALEMIENFKRGERHFRHPANSPAVESTETHRRYYERTVEGMDRLIAAYEGKDA